MTEAAGPTGPMQIERVLLIDDNEADNVFHELVVREAGFAGELQIFELASEALEFLRGLHDDARPTLIFLDLNMPGMDGWEFAREAEALLLRLPRTRVMMLTSSAYEEDQRRARASSVIRGFLTKPLLPDVARQMLAGTSAELAAHHASGEAVEVDAAAGTSG